MKILYTGIRYEHYDPKRRTSFEYNNFFLTLQAMKDVEVIEHPFDRILEVGKKKFNEELVDLVKRERPDILLAFMYTDELDPAALRYIKERTDTKSIAWFADDYWRFFNYSRHLASCFSWVVTTYSKAAEWYKKAGFQNVILSAWACNDFVYRPLSLTKDIDVSLVGQYKPPRGRIIKVLEKSEIDVQAFGFGWPNGKISQEEMIKVFSRSKISLNLNVRPGFLSPRVIARIFFAKSINRVKLDFHLVDNLCAYFHFPILHTHARPFELAGCRAFVISGYSEDIGRYYTEDKEMVFYRTLPELVEKVRYYLPREEECSRIARAAYDRTLREHTYQHRFRAIFKVVGVK